LRGMRDSQYQVRGGRVSDVGGSRGEALDPDVAVRLRGEVDVEIVVRRIMRMKRDAQQPALATAQHSARYVEKGSALEDAILDHAYSSTLLDDEDSSVVEWLGEEYRARKSGRYKWCELESEARRGRASGICCIGAVARRHKEGHHGQADQPSHLCSMIEAINEGRYTPAMLTIYRRCTTDKN
jgi:rhamnose utilization protein RhaD (predicted bifunctional aldolase and dehydrogenase)